MKVIDVIFGLIAGRMIGLLLTDFLKEWGIKIGFYYILILWIALPFFSLFCLWLAYLIGRRFLFVFQGAKFLLVGTVATVTDLKIFELLVWSLSIYILAKIISFIIATLLKYWGNKYWTFGKNEIEYLNIQSIFLSLVQKKNYARQNENKFSFFPSLIFSPLSLENKEIIQFFFITVIGLIIDVASFYYFTKIMGSQFGIPVIIWIKLSVVFAAIVAALWNFLGYKFLVFKK